MKRLILVVFLSCAAAHAQVVKCKIDGKTVYSNEGCNGGFVVKNIEVQQSTGVTLASPREVKTNVERAQIEIANREQIERMENARVQNKVITMPSPSRTRECPEIQNRLNELYAQARMPLSGWQHDEIRRVIRDLRDLQTTYRC